MKPDKKKEIRRVAGSLGTIRAWSDHADSDRLYAKENVDTLQHMIYYIQEWKPLLQERK